MTSTSSPSFVQSPVLVVDDNDALRLVIQRAIEATGLVVWSCAHPQAALELLQTTSVAIVLTDLSMPDMSGWEFCRRVRLLHPNIALAVMTGWGGADQAQLMAHNIRFLVTKPFNVRELQMQVLTALSDGAAT